MSVERKQISDLWEKELFPNKEVVIMDPDGWDRGNWDYSWFEEEITENEFMMRVFRSTCSMSREYMEKLNKGIV